MSQKPRPLALVKFEAEHLSQEVSRKYPFEKDVAYVFLGEIPNMPGHCVVLDQASGRIFCGYHIENFRELRMDEV